MRAAVAVLVEPSKRPLAYGFFGAGLRLAWAPGCYAYTALLGELLHMVLYAAAVSAATYLYSALAGPPRA